MTLSKKIFIYIFILGLFPVIVITLMFNIYFVPNIKKSIDVNVDLLSEVIADNVYNEILHRVKVVSVLSNKKVFIGDSFIEQEYQNEVNIILKTHTSFKSFLYISSTGEKISSGDIIDDDFSALISKVREKKDVDIYIESSESPIRIAYPVFSSSDIYMGLLIAYIDSSILYNIIELANDKIVYDVWIVDSRETVICSPLNKVTIPSIINNVDEVDIHDNYYLSKYKIKNKNNQLKLDWTLYVVDETGMSYTTLNRFKVVYFIRGVVTLILFILIVIFVSLKLKGRIAKLKEVTYKLGEGDYSAEILDDGKDEISDLIQVFSSTREILKNSENKLIKANNRFELAVKGAKDVIWDWDVIKDRLYISNKWWDLLDEKRPLSEYITMVEYKSYIHPDDVSYFGDMLNSYFNNSEDLFEVEYRVGRTENSIKWILTRGIVVRNQFGVHVRMAGSHTDITSRKIMEQKMAFNAYYDTLTELPNRNMLLDRLKQALSRASRKKSFTFSILFLDFDGFKHVNDTYGHDVGDQLLIDIGTRLKECIRPLDIVARIGGDEFVILIDGVGNKQELIPILNRIIITSKNEFIIKNKSIFTSVSIGVVIEEDGYSSPEEIIQRSDIAMYHSKIQGKSRFTFFTEELRKDEVRRWSLEHELHKALGSKALQIYYQPIVDTQTGVIHSFEALMRWDHPVKGMISPVDFIPAAEDTGFITNMTKWLINKVCRQLSTWESEGHRIHISFNVTAKDFFINGGLDRFIKKIIKSTGCNPRMLALEVTEGVMIKDYENVTKQLENLRAEGLSIKLDDFGTGYSSLSYLNKFEIDYIKIDKSFIKMITTDTLSRKIVKSIISLARDVGLKTIAEGVEIEEERRLLKKWNCDYIQGFYYSKPLSLENTIEYLNRK